MSSILKGLDKPLKSGLALTKRPLETEGGRLNLGEAEKSEMHPLEWEKLTFSHIVWIQMLYRVLNNNNKKNTEIPSHQAK